MIYDCFIFFNEIDLLKIRLNELDSVVDKFIIVEGKQTHSGKNKKLNFPKAKKDIKKFLNKITYITVNLEKIPNKKYLLKMAPVDYVNKNPEVWAREIYQRNCIKMGLTKAKPNDIIMISDIDEIPNKEKILQINNKDKVYGFKQDLYYYYSNCISTQEEWIGTKTTFFKNLTTAQELRMLNSDEIIENGGWHFSFLGGVKAIKEKIKSFSHQDYNTKKITNRRIIELKINNGLDIFDRPIEFKIIRDNNKLPEYILNNKSKYNIFFKKDSNLGKNSLFLTNEIIKLRKNINQLKKKINN